MHAVDYPTGVRDYWLAGRTAGRSSGRPGDSLPCVAARYETEFFVNALLYPRLVFTRISEHVSPGRRMLDRTVHFEFVAHDVASRLRILGKDDVEVKSNPGGSAPCNLIVPVTFMKRGTMTIRTTGRIADGGSRYP